MSGPTGIRGFQGVPGDVGAGGSIGITGMVGPQGFVGPTGVTGATGITGSTGIQLYGNDSLVQCLSLGGGATTVTNNYLQPFRYTGSNPELFNGESTTISGYYGTSKLNRYSNPLSLDVTEKYITIPPGKYFITAVMTVNREITPSTFVAYLALSSFVDPTYTDIVKGTPASPGGESHLQYVYIPTTDTVVSLRVHTSNGGEALFRSTAPSPKNVSLSIVRIW